MMSVSKINFFIDIQCILYPRKNLKENDILFCFEIKYKGYGEKAVI
jgi:hypothetical protein